MSARQEGGNRKRRLRRLRAAIRSQNGCLCHICGKELDPEEATLDHLKPKARGGTKAGNNIRLACRECNMDRASTELTYYRMQRLIVTRWPFLDPDLERGFAVRMGGIWKTRWLRQFWKRKRERASALQLGSSGIV